MLPGLLSQTGQGFGAQSPFKLNESRLWCLWVCLQGGRDAKHFWAKMPKLSKWTIFENHVPNICIDIGTPARCRRAEGSCTSKRAMGPICVAPQQGADVQRAPCTSKRTMAQYMYRYWHPSGVHTCRGLPARLREPWAQYMYRYWHPSEVQTCTK